MLQRLKRNIILIALAIAAFIAPLVPATPVSAARNFSYAWTTTGSGVDTRGGINISLGGKVVGLMLPYNADPSNVYHGTFKATNSGGIFGGDKTCYNAIWIRLTGNNSGNIITPLGQNEFPAERCNGMPAVGTGVSISGSRPQGVENENQRGIRVRVFGDPKGKKIVVIFKGSKPGDVTEFELTDKGDGYYYRDFTSDPDTYTVSCKPGLPFECGQVTVEKRKYIPLVGCYRTFTDGTQTGGCIDLGESPDDKEVSFRLYVDCTEVKEDFPYQMAIYNDKNKKVATVTATQGGIDTGINSKLPPGVLNTGCLHLGTAPTVKGLKAGTYTACIVGRKHCVPFTKVFAQSAVINLLFGFSGIPKDDIVCAAGMLGWLLCPLAELTKNFSKIVAQVVEGLLFVEPLTLNTSGDNPIYVTWSIVRDIANIVFIILFLVIVFSQATSMGMSNYGIKRLLPRLLIMVILVNLSYFICAFAIDVFNLIGAGVKGFIQVGIDAAPRPNLGKEEWDGSYSGFFVALFASIFALALLGPLWAILALIFTAVALAIITGFIVLVVRQVLIVLLVLLSPLAFAAALLPNTEDWFNRWRKTFTSLLLSYPIMMFVFYGSALVAAVVGATMMPK